MPNFRFAKYSIGGGNPAIDDPNKLSGDDNLPLTTAQAAAVAYIVPANRLPRWKTALAAMRAGTRNARLMVLADSTGAGALSLSAAGNGYTSNNYSASWPVLLKARLEAMGIPANTDNCVNDNTSLGVATIMTNDFRQTLAAHWLASGNTTAGGAMYTNSVAGSLQPRTFTPAQAFDTIELVYLDVTSYGKAILSIDGGATALGAVIDMGTTAGSVQKVTRTVPLGNYTVTLRRSAATGADGDLNSVYIRTYNSAVKCVEILNSSVGGTNALAQSDDSTFFAPLSVNVSSQLAPDLVIICLDINDWIAGLAPGTYDLVTAATHRAYLQKIITKFLPTTDVVLMTGAPSDVSRATLANQLATLRSTRVLAEENNIPLIDISAQWGPFLFAQAAGFYATGDTVHPGAVGYADIATRASEALRA
jgi:lysophospholipase L1-like esterase